MTTLPATAPELTASDVSRYHRDGFLIVRGLFSPDEVGDLKSRLNDIAAEEVTRFPIEKALMDPGDAIFFSSLTYHFSEPNRSAHRRLSVAGIYLPREELAQSLAISDWVANRKATNRSCVMAAGEVRDDLAAIAGSYQSTTDPSSES